MSRHYGHIVITFNDGTTERVGGNRHHLTGDGTVLVVCTAPAYGGELRDVRNFPIASIREYHWED
ncbi:UNVERIFIED_ORG: hypothetical protein ABID57_001302 [Arthrobacter sp. UYEF1]